MLLFEAKQRHTMDQVVQSYFANYRLSTRINEIITGIIELYGIKYDGHLIFKLVVSENTELKIES